MKASRAPENTIIKYLDSENVSFTIDNFINSADEISKRLVLHLPKYLHSEKVKSIRIGLREIIINSIEHGNLNITFDEKSKAVHKGNYLSLLRKRQQEKKYKDRKVKVSIDMNRERVLYEISDEGNGFDFDSIMADISQRIDNELIVNGRGITMAMNIFDNIEYNEYGNRVQLLKKFS